MMARSEEATAEQETSEHVYVIIINVTLASRRLDGVRGHRVAHCPSGGALIPSPDP